MKNLSLLHAILAFVFSSLGLTGSDRQQTATDAKVLHDVNAVLENERAFRRLMTVLKVSHGNRLKSKPSQSGIKPLASIND